MPVLKPIAAGPKPVTLTAVIQHGKVLAERQVLISIGEEGEAPQLHRGDYGDLLTLIEIAISQYFAPRPSVELAEAELDTQAELVL